MTEEHELNDEQMQKVRKQLSDPNNLRMIVAITLIIIALFVGSRIGYMQGYSYVNDWYEEYIDRECFCPESYSQNKNSLYGNYTQLVDYNLTLLG